MLGSKTFVTLFRRITSILSLTSQQIILQTDSHFQGNCDTEYNTFGRSLIELCYSHDIHMLNGRFSDPGHYTCIANGGHSTVDHILVSSPLFQCKSLIYLTIFQCLVVLNLAITTLQMEMKYKSR